MTVEGLPAPALLSSAPHKQEAWLASVPIVAPGVRPITIPVPRGLREPDVLDPAAVTGKLLSFARLPGMVKKLEKSGADMAVVADVLCIADGLLVTTDREDIGAMLTLAMLVEHLNPGTAEDRPVTIHAYNTMGVVPVRALKERNGSKLRDCDIGAAWDQLDLTLSAGLVQLLGNSKELKRLHRAGYLGGDVWQPRSIAGLDWVEFIRFLPGIAAMRKGDDLWMEAMTGNEYHRVDSQMDDTEPVHELLNTYLKGMAHGVLKSILTG